MSPDPSKKMGLDVLPDSMSGPYQGFTSRRNLPCLGTFLLILTIPLSPDPQPGYREAEKPIPSPGTRQCPGQAQIPGGQQRSVASLAGMEEIPNQCSPSCGCPKSGDYSGPYADTFLLHLPHLPPADKDRDKAKDKYVRSLWKLFAHHNRYVLGVRAAQLHHQHHHQLMLPSLLQSLQDLHEEMVHIL